MPPPAILPLYWCMLDSFSFQSLHDWFHFFPPHTKCLVIYILLGWAQNLAKLKPVQGTLEWCKAWVVWKITGIGGCIVSLINTRIVHNCLTLSMLESLRSVVFREIFWRIFFFLSKKYIHLGFVCSWISWVVLMIR